MKFKFVLLTILIAKISFALTLEEAEKEALKRNLEIKSEEADLDITKLDIKIAENLYLPEYFLNLSYTMLKDDVYTKIPPNQLIPVTLEFQQYKDKYKEFEIGLNYLIYANKQREYKKNISELNLDVEKLDLERKKREILLKVRLAYVDVLIAKSLINIWKKELEAVKLHLKRVKEYFKKGYATKVEILQTRVRLAEIKRELRKAEGNLKIAEANLNKILNQNINQPIEVDEIKINLPRSISLEELIEEALINREELKILKRRKDQFLLSSEIYKAEYYPKFYFQGKYFYTDKFPAIEPKSNYSVSLLMTVKFQSKIPYLKYKQELKKKEKLELDRKKIEEDIKLQIKAAYENYKVAFDNLKVAKESLKEAKEYHAMVIEQYKYQLASTTDVLDAEVSLTRAREGYKMSYYQLLKEYFKLIYAVGINKVK